MCEFLNCLQTAQHAQCYDGVHHRCNILAILRTCYSETVSLILELTICDLLIDKFHSGILVSFIENWDIHMTISHL